MSPTGALPEPPNETDPFEEAERARHAAARALVERVALEEEAERATLRARDARQARLQADERAERATAEAENAERARLAAEDAARRARIAAEAAELDVFGEAGPVEKPVLAHATDPDLVKSPSRRAVLVRLTYVLLGAAVLGLTVLNVLAWSGGLVDEPEDESARTQAAPRADPAPAPPDRSAERAATPATARPSIPTVALSAVRGECWVSVRGGTEAGEILYEGVLAPGDSLQFKQRKLWLRLGAASNLEITVDGKRAEVAAGTVDVVLPA